MLRQPETQPVAAMPRPRRHVGRSMLVSLFLALAAVGVGALAGVVTRALGHSHANQAAPPRVGGHSVAAARDS